MRNNYRGRGGRGPVVSTYSFFFPHMVFLHVYLDANHVYTSVFICLITGYLSTSMQFDY